MKSVINLEYKEWLHSLKLQIKNSQIKAAISVNSQLIMLYWDLGRQIVEKQENAKWGSSFLKQLSNDLKEEFPDMTGLSYINLHYCRSFYSFYSAKTDCQTHKEIIPQVVEQLQHTDRLTNKIIPQLVDEININQLILVPWGHHRLIIDKVKDIEQALFYINKTIENSWSRAVLEYQIDTNLFKRTGNVKTNFKATLPEPDSDLANEIVKNEYNFEFLNISEKVKETELEKALLQHMTEFLIELGLGFAFVGRQYHINVGGDDFMIDLLFYHIKLKCYIVVELKVKDFSPEYIGQLGFYVTAIDKQVKGTDDNPTIGILLCKNKNDVVVDYTLENYNKPIGVSKFIHSEEEIKKALPSAQDLQDEIKNFIEK